MANNNKDHEMMTKCIEEAKKLFSGCECEHPLDEEVADKIKCLRDLIRVEDDDFEIFKHRKTKIDPLWKLLIEKAIKCLRYYDKREPFIENKSKKPKAYGVDELVEYYEQYTEFERVLYGSNQYYRDHVVHVFRTWLSGVDCLVKNDGKYLESISLHEKEDVELENVEKLSIWTIIALTHDLGYPLEKAKDIINTTRSMVSTFIANPDITMDLSFHGVQNYMNDFIVRLMSSKMIPKDDKTGGGIETPQSGGENIEDGDNKKQFVARLQPKYYFKFQKSLEKTQHGIVSTLIIYKLLTYFLESDYNINEDYTFDQEERRQFYIRREILRAIASHTCKDVYHLYMASFAFLLIISDDTQEWGRKYISELYVKSNQEYVLKGISMDHLKGQKECKIEEKIALGGATGVVIDLINRFREQSLYYITIFRDGQDTGSRDFSFKREFLIEYKGKIRFLLILQIEKDNASKLEGKITYTDDGNENNTFGSDFFKKLKETGILDSDENWDISDEKDASVKGKEAETWRKGAFSINLPG
jgi:hypothetical protein